MSDLRETIRMLLKEDPTIIRDALVSNPSIVYDALIKLMPWQNLATKDDIKEMKETMATKEDLNNLRKEMKETMATKEDLKMMATREDLEKLKEEVWRELKSLRIMLDSLGARGGLVNEDAVRNGVKELLASVGYKAEKWVYYDGDGYVYGYASEIDVDILIRNGVRIIAEITSTLKRGDLPFIKRKAELYEKSTGMKPDKVIVITAFIHDKNPDLVVARARMLGIDIIKPGEDVGPQTKEKQK